MAATITYLASSSFSALMADLQRRWRRTVLQQRWRAQAPMVWVRVRKPGMLVNQSELGEVASAARSRHGTVCGQRVQHSKR